MPTLKMIPVKCPKCGLTHRELAPLKNAPSDQPPIIEHWYTGPQYQRIDDKLMWYCRSCGFQFTTLPDDAPNY